MKIRYITFLLSILLLNSCSAAPSQLINPSSSENTQIHDIQGCSHSSPYLGKKVTAVHGIVTWKDDQGFFIEDTTPDAKECSSEAVYVFTKDYSHFIPGDFVAVDGVVDEFTPDPSTSDELTNTEIKSSTITLISTENDLPAPIRIGNGGRIPPDTKIEDDAFSSFDPDTDGIDFYESLEGMRVEIDNASVVGPENAYREVEIIPGESRSKNIISSQGALIATEADVNPERIVLVLPNSYKKEVNLGDHIDGAVIGILTYAYGNYEIIETNMPTISPNKIKPPALQPITKSDQLRVATYNVENFSRFDSTRMDKISAQIVKSLGSPDILLLEEIQDDSGSEDDGTTSASKTLEELSQKIVSYGGPEYAFLDSPQQNDSSGGVGGGNIRTVILYRTDRGVKLVKDQIKITGQNLSAFTNSRIPIVGKFIFHDQSVIVIGVHLISNNANSPLFGSSQPIKQPDEAKKIAQAQWLATFAANLKKTNPNSFVVIGGDFNDTPDSATLSTLQKAGFTDAANYVPVSERYSLLFEGNAYLYDQILVSEDEHFVIDNSTPIHINTYMNDNEQISDHDPFVVDLTVK